MCVWDRLGEARKVLAGKVRPGTVWRVRVWYDAVMHGRRVMVRLGAVLCGTVMYGLVWLARLGRVLQGVVWHVLAG